MQRVTHSNDAGNCLAVPCIIYMTRCLFTTALSTYCMLKLFQRYNFHVRATLWVSTKFSMRIQCHVIVCIVRLVVSAWWRDCDRLSRSWGSAAGTYVQGTCTSTSTSIQVLTVTHNNPGFWSSCTCTCMCILVRIGGWNTTCFFLTMLKYSCVVAVSATTHVHDPNNPLWRHTAARVSTD